MAYKALFDELGYRITTFDTRLYYPNDIPVEAIEITNEEQELYATGLYMRDVVTALPVLIPEQGPTLVEFKKNKLADIDRWTASAITDGFTSAATEVTATYDSTEADQQNIMLMLQAAQTTDFATHPVYKGQIPIRAVPEGQTSKVVFHHNAEQMQQVVIDMALHIGMCKQKGWKLQEAVAAAETVEEIEAIKWPE